MTVAPIEDDLLAPQDWSFPVPIAYGPGRLAEMGERCAAMGLKNPLIVTDRGSRDLPFIGQLQEVLAGAGFGSAVFSDVSPNPRDDEIGAGRAMFREGGHDAVIAIGGGSAMDGGKSVCLTATNEIDLWDFDFDKTPPDMRGQPAFPTLICIPTTAGTGAETESTGMVTHVGRGMKLCVWHPELKPSLALLDPALTVGLPRNLTAWTGADALTHAIEAYSVPGFNPLCDGLALQAMTLIGRWLPVAVEEPENLEARGGMLAGSCLAGIAFLKGLGMVHAISHMVGAEYDTQHGLTNAVVLPQVVRFNLPVLGDKPARMAEAMGLGALSGEEFASHVEGILDGLGIPRSLKEIGVPDDCAARIAGKAIQDVAATTNPRQATEAEIQALIEAALTQARPG
uniref:iron-containing alcohol dehydrogenase n=1 Tax=Roseovarius indicus TaxID=540747 RepID=UPI003B52B313